MQVNDALTAIQKLVSSLKTLKSTLNDTMGSSNNNQLKKNADSSVDKMTRIKKALNFGMAYIGIRKTWNSIKNLSIEYTNMIESNNLFEVSMGKVVNQYGELDEVASTYYVKAIAFQNEMNEKLATNEAELKKYQAMYFSMFKSQGINKDASYFMSEQLTEAGYDIASLYNLTVDDAMDKIKAGIAGQVEPLRKIGIDISESALTKVIREVGITDRNVQQLSYAEKELARYIAIVEQASQAQGDFAKTFEQPANQIRVFKNQLLELKQVAGAFIVNEFGNILVYANSIIMVLKEILKSFANLFGYDLASGGANLTDSLEDVNNGLSSATGKAKELKKQLMGFDEINNIAPNSSTKIGTGTLTGIDDKLLNSLKEWDNKMEGISGKAQQIRDKILEWLGFIKEIDPVTGEVSFKIKEGWTNLKKILTVIKAITALYVGVKIVSLIGKISLLIKSLKDAKNISGTFGEGLKVIVTGVKNLKSGFSNLISWVKLGAEQFNIFRQSGDNVATALLKTGNSMLDLVPKTVKVAGGIVGLVSSSILAYKSMQDLSNEAIGTTEAFGKLAISIASATASGALIGSVFGTAGTAIGALLGLTVSSVSAWVGYNDNISKALEESKKLTEQTQKSLDTYKENTKAINDSATAKLSELQKTEDLCNELNNLVDSNGKVKNGYEERVDFILGELNEAYGTEVSVVDGVITKYDEFKNKIDELIQTKKAEIVLSANEEKYTIAIKNQTQAVAELQEMEKHYANNKESLEKKKSQLLEEQKKIQDVFTLSTMLSLKKEIDTLENNIKAYENKKEEVEGYYNDIYNYELLQTAVLTENSELQSQAIENFTNTINTNGQEIIASEKVKLEKIKLQAEQYIRIQEQKGEAVTETERNMLDSVLTMLGSNLANQTQTVEDLTDENISAWETLAKGSQEKYNEYVSTLPDDARIVIEAINGNIDLNSHTQIQKWANLAKNNKTVYEKGLSGLDITTSQRIQSCVDAINNKSWTAEQAAKGLADAVERGANTIDTSQAGKYAVEGVASGIEKNKNSWTLWNSIKGLKDAIVSKVKELLGIHSPSRVMADLAQYIPLGIAKGIDDEADSVYASIKKIHKGIEMNTKDLVINTNQYVDYGVIKGQVQAQSNVTINDNVTNRMAEATYNAFCKAMRSEGIKVNIEAKTEEGVIVQKASEGFANYVMKTGELPFPVPV